MAMLQTTLTSLSQDQGNTFHVETVFTEDINDSIAVEVKVRRDEHGLPVHYFCHVNTPVCEEGLCKLMVLDVYWDILGNFLRYELPSGEHLTKFDHLPFTDDDHAKLSAILSDRASILRDYPVDDLVDNSIIRKSEVVDAVSAATRVEVRDAIVNGAVYSTYVLWHIVNGPIASKIEAHAEPMISDALVRKMFRAQNIHYQYYALTHYPKVDSLLYVPEVINLVKNGIDYIPYFAVESVPAWAWADEKYQVELVSHFQAADFQLQNAFLDKLGDVAVSARTLDLLIASLETVSDKQRIKVLQIGERNKTRLSAMAKEAIARFQQHRNAEVSALARRLLAREKRNRE